MRKRSVISVRNIFEIQTRRGRLKSRQTELVQNSNKIFFQITQHHWQRQSGFGLNSLEIIFHVQYSFTVRDFLLFVSWFLRRVASPVIEKTRYSKFGAEGLLLTI